MNSKKKIRSLMLTALTVAGMAIGLSGCTKEEIMPNETPQHTPLLNINVNDTGFATANGTTPQTRITNGLHTEFTVGDEIAVNSVKDGKIIDKNVRLKLTNIGGELVWNIVSGKLTADPDLQYFACYPFTNYSDVSATTAEEFYSTYIKENGWMYGAQDVMVDESKVELTSTGYSLSFEMRHVMALLVIELPLEHWSLNSDESYGWAIERPHTQFSNILDGNFRPKLVGSTYHYISNPMHAPNGQYPIKGEYMAANNRLMKFDFTMPSRKGEYTHYKVDGGMAKKTHHLQVGDFYLKDGSLVGKDAVLTDAQKKNCLGVVYRTGNLAQDNYGLLDNKFPKGTHAIVAALTDNPPSLPWSSWEKTEFVSDWLKNAVWSEGIRPSGFNSITVSDKMQGYANTRALQEYNKSFGNVIFVCMFDNFEIAHPTPANSSGWFCPSIKELEYMIKGNSATGIAGKQMLNLQFPKVSIYGWEYELLGPAYWSSTEDKLDSAFFIETTNGAKVSGKKTENQYLTRPVLVF